MRTTAVNHEPESLHIGNIKRDVSYRQATLSADYFNIMGPVDFASCHETAKVITTFGSTNNLTSFLALRICLPTHKGFTVIRIEDIVYCEAQRSYTRFHLIGNKSVTVSKPLFAYDRLLSGANFIRIHKSFFINLVHMKEYTRGEGGTVLMSNGMEIDVSRRRKELFLNSIKESFRYSL